MVIIQGKKKTDDQAQLLALGRKAEAGYKFEASLVYIVFPPVRTS